MPNTKKHNLKNVDLSQNLRKNLTPQERKLWFCFLRDLPIKFRRQITFGKYIVDFYCPEHKIVIELDGSQHYEKEAENYDEKRDEFLRSMGLTVYRYTNLEVDTKFDAVCVDIGAHIGLYK